MEEFTIRPILGLRTDVAQNDPSLFEGPTCHCVSMQNVDLDRIRNASSKATGRTQYSATANAQHTKCLGLFELKGSSATDHLFWDNGKFYYLASDRTFTAVDAAVAVNFGTADSALVSAIQVGNYVVMADRAATLTPYIWKNSDANLTKLIKTGTEYKFRYLAPFQRRVIGAYSDQTNGDIEIRWTQPWTNADYFTSACTMAAANQLYKSGNDSIVGIKPMGANACLLYGENSIDSIDYYANYTMPFAINNRIANHGAVNHHSIVDAGIHYFFNKHYGFVGYAGGNEFPYGGVPISYDIEDILAGINPAYYHQIVGKFIPHAKECVWAVPLDGAATPNTLLRYDLLSKQWSIKKNTCRFIDFWTLDSALIWNDLAALGYTYWTDFGLLRWSDLVSSTPYVVSADTNGHVYTDTGESDAGAAWDGYRIEPIISLGETPKALLLEIWLGLASIGSFSIYIYYRKGDTEAECESAPWTALDEISANSPDNAVTYVNAANATAARFHQIKWGTDAASEVFSVNTITFKYVPQGSY